MLEFISAVYNEESEIDSLVEHISPYVDRINFVDDVSTDRTVEKLGDWWEYFYYRLGTRDDPEFTWHSMGEHSGLPETVKNEALKVVNDGSWVLMLDADERFSEGVLEAVRAWINGPEAVGKSYVYFRQLEIIDGQQVREFQKCKLFKKEAMQFPLDNIHMDDVLSGNGIYRDDWVVLHRKSSSKQIQREIEYLDTYERLFQEGKIDAGRKEWLRGLHHYVRNK